MQGVHNIDLDSLQETAGSDSLADFHADEPATTHVRVSFTVVESNNLLTKTVVVGDDGKPVTSGKISLTRGEVRRITLTGTATEIMDELAGRLSKLGRRKALICAPPPPGRDVWPLVMLDEAEGRDDVVARSPRYFKPSDGPSLLFIDADVKDYPTQVRAKLAGRSPLDILCEAFPFFARAVCVSRPSSGAGIRNRETGYETPSDAGVHYYFLVADGSDIDAFIQRLADRLTLQGWGWTKVSKAGSLLDRTLIDVAASRDPSRLAYEADAFLNDKRLEHVPGVRDPVVWPGSLLDTAMLSPLTDAEQADLETIRATLDAEVEAERVATKATYVKERTKELVKRGVAPAEAQRILSDAVETHVLGPDFPILLDDGRTVTVREIVAKRARITTKRAATPWSRTTTAAHGTRPSSSPITQ